MSIPLDLARTLAVVVEEGTLDAAARRLHVTPSAVSQRVRALEDQLGRVVLVRSKPVRTTEAGDAVVRLARQLALLEHDALAAIGAEGGVVASLPLAVNADSMGTWFLPPLARVAERRAVVFDLHRDDQDFTVGLLESGTVMAAVTSRETPLAGCRVRPLGVLRYEAVATAGFSRRWFPEGVDAGALAAAPVVDFDRRDDLQTQWLARRGVAAAAPPRHRVPASQDFATAVELGLGWGLLPSFQSAAGLADGSLVPLGDDPLDVPLYWQQWNLTSDLLDDVADEVVAEGRRVLAAG
ncbi:MULTISPECIES: LysR family transcriptional regulator ArgP [unclassified Microbacterium]|uniref:LysR family transcriptional regulator ArgP n=1 Tax=unclassified Microbacterium TaxID=2609290 RepID=UPI0006FED969|nr:MULTISPECIES: LysR family transcriptional regulator ArgP [unclassified Microbacterium]KQR86632.1 chromosome replication initiation inhibitor protein [Microbacterium sp. Leaf179]KQT72060.1 chromosome replication initiation inhibitor protein [Microbacterium sp. Leaf436]MBD8206585.1 LysR family transcriptional regulator ArgP [Microbacterium sp. CFBP 8801]MBD8479119.1 LysR family transcriptional regulator ArgP [Microbacterium sp. CFBP 8794]MBD8510221.1 LysR family transcriptional regulator ArgP